MDFNQSLLKDQAFALAVYKEKIAKYNEAGKDVIDFTLGDPDEETCSHSREAIVNYLKDNIDSSYPPTPGTATYLNAVADWAKRLYDLDIDPNKHVLACNGTKEAIYSFPLMFDWQENQKVLIPALSYPVYVATVRHFGIPYLEVPLSIESNFFPDLDNISEKTWKACKIFWINSPHNPTSAIASKEYCLKLLELSKEHDFLIASDEAYGDTYYEEKPFSFLEEQDSTNWIVFRSLSKRSNMTGYRAGAIITKNEELLKYFRKMRLPAGVAMPNVIDVAATAAWNDETHVAANRELYKEKCALLKAALEEKGFEVFGAKAAFYLWFSHPKIKSADALFELFLEAGLGLVPGTAFGPEGEGFIRLAYTKSRKLCEEAVKRISQITA